MDLKEFFAAHRRIALAFSGGVDSAYLLHAAMAAGADVTAYYVKSPFQPAFELRDAERLASELGARMVVIPLDVLSDETILRNPPDRCYHCKKLIFTAIREAAERDGYAEIMDGTNASDDAADRPGIRALGELRVYSPLRLTGVTKDEVRRLSRESGLFTWDKPAYACLATRVPTGEAITAEKLAVTERAEEYLESLGFSDFRVRYLSGGAKLQLPAGQLPLLLEKREEILATLKKFYTSVLLDLEVRG